ncbi:MAG: hypothetical protein AB1726_11355 [Planctomycetota bacterium]
MDETLDQPSRAPVFLRALRAAVGRAPLWLICWSVPLLLGLAVALPFVAALGSALEHAYAPGAVLPGMDEVFRHDHAGAIAALRGDADAGAAFLGFAMILVGIFTAGGWLQVFLERTSGHSVRRFVWGGVKYFWRFFRVFLLTVLVLAAVSWLCFGWPWKALVLDFLFGAEDGDLHALHSERTALGLTWLQDGLYGLAFALVLAWGDYTRTRLALHDTRSALWAGLCTLVLLLRHPARTLRPFLFLFLVEWVLAIELLGRLSWRTNAGIDAESTWKPVALLFVLGQLAMIVQVIARAARYKAAVLVSRVLVQPLPQRDPWGKRVGGPGGPQYPIDETDEYGISF